MTVIVLSDCPVKLRGDITKWLVEINSGVYVGRISARVRMMLWERICTNLHTGKATMVFRSNNEQRLEFLTHNSKYEPVDYDGIILMRRPSTASSGESSLGAGYSRAAKQQFALRKQISANTAPCDYSVIDIETTGLDVKKDEIIEVGALRVRNNVITETFSKTIKTAIPLPYKITQLTGLTNVDIEKGSSLSAVLKSFVEFIDGDIIICHNCSFDMRFLAEACKKENMPVLRNKVIDTLPLARRKLALDDYKLISIAKHFGIDVSRTHRALDDCVLSYQVYTKLNEKPQN